MTSVGLNVSSIWFDEKNETDIHVHVLALSLSCLTIMEALEFQENMRSFRELVGY